MVQETAFPSRDMIVDKMAQAFAKVTEKQLEASAMVDGTKLRDDLGLDSFAALELLFELEEMLNVRIPQEAAASFVTVGDVVVYVQAQLTTPPVAEPKAV
ncbi:MAG: phosphopantetheine-binding protein [Deltaproteobacteria bacterium]|nr:phosphopantetheine-binding protein [Deltaproteobacteria bacterium]